MRASQREGSSPLSRTILISDLASGNGAYVVAMVTLAGFALIGLAAALRLPTDHGQLVSRPMTSLDAHGP
jgi:hypothetical protein